MAAMAEKRKQKRTAATISEPKTKKVRLESAAGATKSSADKGKKRSQPVTLPLKNESSTSSDEGSEHEFEEGGDVEDEAGDEGLSQPAKDPNGTPSHCYSSA